MIEFLDMNEIQSIQKLKKRFYLSMYIQWFRIFYMKDQFYKNLRKHYYFLSNARKVFIKFKKRVLKSYQINILMNFGIN